MKRSRTWLVIVLATLVVVGGATLAIRKLDESHNRAPYGPEAIAATASLKFVGYQEAWNVLGPGANIAIPEPGGMLLHGHVSWQTPPQGSHGERYVIVVVDNRTNLAPVTFGFSKLNRLQHVAGSMSPPLEVAERYPWLNANGNGSQDDNRIYGNAVFISELNGSPLDFVAVFPAASVVSPHEQGRYATAPVELADLVVALAFVGPENQVYWAQRLHG